MKPYLLISLILFAALLSCEKSKPQKNSDNPLKPITEVTYQEIIGAVLIGEGRLVNYRGESTSTEAKYGVRIKVKDDKNCKEPICGSCVYLINYTDERIRVLVRSPFEIGPWHSDAVSEFLLEEKGQVLIGCSHFCHGKDSYPVEHYVIGAEYLE